MGFLHVFFPSGPPQPAERPSDDTVVHHIRTLVQYAAKNGTLLLKSEGFRKSLFYVSFSLLPCRSFLYGVDKKESVK